MAARSSSVAPLVARALRSWLEVGSRRARMSRAHVRLVEMARSGRSSLARKRRVGLDARRLATLELGLVAYASPPEAESALATSAESLASRVAMEYLVETLGMMAQLAEAPYVAHSEVALGRMLESVVAVGTSGLARTAPLCILGAIGRMLTVQMACSRSKSWCCMESYRLCRSRSEPSTSVETVL